MDERRKHDCKYEEDIGYIKASLQSIDKRINGTLDEIRLHIAQGEGWRKAIIGIIFAGCIQVVSFAYLFGCLYNEVQEHDKRFGRIFQREMELIKEK